MSTDLAIRAQPSLLTFALVFWLLLLQLTAAGHATKGDAQSLASTSDLTDKVLNAWIDPRWISEVNPHINFKQLRAVDDNKSPIVTILSGRAPVQSWIGNNGLTINRGVLGAEIISCRYAISELLQLDINSLSNGDGIVARSLMNSCCPQLKYAHLLKYEHREGNRNPRMNKGDLKSILSEVAWPSSFHPLRQSDVHTSEKNSIVSQYVGKYVRLPDDDASVGCGSSIFLPKENKESRQLTLVDRLRDAAHAVLSHRVKLEAQEILFCSPSKTSLMCNNELTNSMEAFGRTPEYNGHRGFSSSNTDGEVANHPTWLTRSQFVVPNVKSQSSQNMIGEKNQHINYREITGSGFGKLLKTCVSFKTSEKSMHILSWELIPMELFVDPYELQRKMKTEAMNKTMYPSQSLTFTLFDFTDVEAVHPLGRASSILVIIDTESSNGSVETCYEIPLRLRYQEPVAKPVSNSILNPIVSPTEMHSLGQQSIEIVGSYSSNAIAGLPEPIIFFESSSGTPINFPIESEDSEYTLLYVPVADTRIRPAVEIGHLSVLIASALILLFTIYSFYTKV